MVDVKRKKNESFEGLIRKFNKRIMQSGKVLQAKKVQRLEKKINRNKRKALALRRNEIKTQTEFLRKTGTFKEE
ncbi:30S ribosomal protein S21 [Candidatus Falkowbacteria bacterium]|nr:30S ribosomal protein S21 [Candidatus Falkowbacteria bacterium]